MFKTGVLYRYMQSGLWKYYIFIDNNTMLFFNEDVDDMGFNDDVDWDFIDEEEFREVVAVKGIRQKIIKLIFEKFR